MAHASPTFDLRDTRRDGPAFPRGDTPSAAYIHHDAPETPDFRHISSAVLLIDDQLTYRGAINRHGWGGGGCFAACIFCRVLEVFQNGGGIRGGKLLLTNRFIVVTYPPAQEPLWQEQNQNTQERGYKMSKTTQNTTKPAPRHRKAKATPNHRDIMATKYSRKFQSKKGGKVREHTFAEAAAYFADVLTYATGAPFLQQTALIDVFDFNLVLRSMYSSNNEYSAAFWKLDCNQQILNRFGGDHPDIAKRRTQAMGAMSKGFLLAEQSKHFRTFLNENADATKPCTSVTPEGLIKPFNAWVCRQPWSEDIKAARVAVTKSKRKALLEDVKNGFEVAQSLMGQSRKGGGKGGKQLNAEQLTAAIEDILKANKANKKTRAAVLKALAKSAGVIVEPAGRVTMPKLKSEAIAS